MEKNIIITLTALFLLLSSYQGTAQKTPNKEVRIDVLYFHGTIRCHGCLTIEEFIKRTLYQSFSNELKDSIITLTNLDFQQPENEHYQQDYKFDTQTLILSRKINGKETKWKNLDKIWDKYSNYDKFKEYIIEEINKFKKEN